MYIRNNLTITNYTITTETIDSYERGDVYYPTKVLYHPYFTKDTLNKMAPPNDIALAKTDIYIQFKNSVNAICMPSIYKEPSNDSLVVIGFGNIKRYPAPNEDPESIIPRFLQKVVNLVNISESNRLWGTTETD